MINAGTAILARVKLFTFASLWVGHCLLLLGLSIRVGR